MLLALLDADAPSTGIAAGKVERPGAEEGVEHGVAGLRGGQEDALEQCDGNLVGKAGDLLARLVLHHRHFPPVVQFAALGPAGLDVRTDALVVRVLVGLTH